MANSFRCLPVWQYVMTVAWISLASSLAFVEDATVFQSIPVVGGYLYYANSNWRFVIQILFAVIVVLHIFEALQAAYLANLIPISFYIYNEGKGFQGSPLSLWQSSNMSLADTIKWVLQTFLVGVFSLNVLREQSKETKKKP